jgi:hypothetical protein
LVTPGNGLTVSITGSSVLYAQGGTGAEDVQASPANATIGGGGHGGLATNNGQNGNNGIVIIRYRI